MEPPSTSTNSVASTAPWTPWTDRGIWAKSALALGVISAGTSIWSMVVGDGITSLSASIQIREAAEALGRLTPFIAVLSVLVEPMRFRGWVYAAILIWGVASALVAVGNLHDSFNLVRELK